MSAAKRLNQTQQHLSSSEFRYTLPDSANVLTLEQRKQYEELGYFIVKGLLNKQDLKKFGDRFIDIAEGRVKPEPTMLVMKDLNTKDRKDLPGQFKYAKLQDFQDDPVLFDYCKHPSILKYVKCITGPDIKSMHTMLINKPPNTGSSSVHPMHQDLHYFPFRPVDRIVCSWTAIDNIDMDNGCLSVIPGTHKGELLPHGYHKWQGKVNKMYHEIAGSVKDQKRTFAIMEPGDTIFFHPLLVHGSGPNVTKDRFRKAISTHFASAHCDYIDVKGTIQENIAQEVEEIAKKRFGNGNPVPFDFVWRIRSRLVAGVEGTL